MNVGQTVEGHTLSPLGSQDSAITSTSVNNDQSLGSPVSKATDGASSSRQVVSESEVSSTSVSGSTSWSLPSASEDKNPFSWMSEEDLSQIDAVLSTEEGKLILQQTGGQFKMDDIEEGPFNAIATLDSPMLADSSHLSDTSNNVEAPPDPFLTTSLFDQNSLLSVTLDTSEMPSVLLQGDELEFEAEPSFTDHAYCLTPKKRGSRSMADPDEKVADLQDAEKMEVDEGTEEKMVIEEMAESDAAVVAERASVPVGRRGRRGRGRGRGGARRSTRIQDNEERQQAEVIRQENLRKEQEAMQAIQGVKGKIPVIKSYHMRTRSPRQNEGWASILGKRRGKRADQSGNEDSQDTGEEEQLTEDQTDAEDRTLDEADFAEFEEEEQNEEEDAQKGKKIMLRGKNASAATKGKKGRGKQAAEDDDDEEEEEEEEEEKPQPKGKGKGKKKGKGITASQEESEEEKRSIGGRPGGRGGRQTRTALTKAAGARGKKGAQVGPLSGKPGGKQKGLAKGAKRKGKVKAQEQEQSEEEEEEDEELRPKGKGKKGVGAKKGQAGKVGAESDSEESDDEDEEEKDGAQKGKPKTAGETKKGVKTQEDSESEEKAEEADDEEEEESKAPKKVRKGKKGAGETTTDGGAKGPKKKGRKGLGGVKGKGVQGKKKGGVDEEEASSDEDVPLTELKISEGNTSPGTGKQKKGKGGAKKALGKKGPTMVSILRVNTVLSSAQMETEGELVIAETPDDSSQNTEAVDTDQGVTPGLDNRPSRRMIRGGKNKDDQNVDEDADKGDSDEEDTLSDPYVDDQNDEDWNSDNDPDRLWCICQQPYGNRFMISCDTCEQWYHGSCVGITRAQGKSIERSNGGWTCPPCCDSKKGRKPKVKKEVVMDVTPVEVEGVKVEVEMGQEVVVESEVVIEETPQEEPSQEEPSQEDSRTSQEDAAPGQSEETPAGPESQDKTPVKTQKEVEEKISPSEKARLQRHQHQEAALHDKFKQLKQRRTRKESEKGDVQEEVQKPKKKKKEKAGGAPSHCIVGGCSNVARPNSVYCSDACIVKHAEESLKVLEKQNMKMYGNRPRPEGKAGEAMKQAERIIVLERNTGKILTGPTAPTAATLQTWLEKHQSYEVLTGSNPSSFYGIKKEKELQKKEAKEKMESKKDMGKEIQAIKEKWEKRERERRERERLEKERLEKERRQKIREKVKAQNQDKLSPEKKPEHQQQQQQQQQKVVKEAIRPPREIRRYPVDLHQRRVEAPHHRPHYREQPHPEPKPVADTSAGPDPVRLNVRKALKDSLSARADEADDILLSGTEIKQIAMAIEDELYRCFGAVTSKYKNRYRSLTFNIRDPKNKGLFRKILNGGIMPAHLARLSSDELASKELAKWREHETKHTLELIEIAEKEAALMGHVVKKTHKGELAVGDEDLSDLVQPLKPSRSSEPRDTTYEHKKHLFDSNCKICTGKMAPPREEERQAPAEVRRVKFSTYMESRAKQAAEAKSAKLAESGNTAEKKEEKVGVGFYREIESASHALPPFSSYTGSDPKVVKGKPGSVVPGPPRIKQKPKIHSKLDPRLKSTVPATEPAVVVSEQVAHESVTVKVDSPRIELDMELGEPVTVSTTTTISSPDSALQSGLEKKPQFPPSLACVWKGFVFMQDLAKFFSHAYCVSGNTDNLSRDLPDTVQVCGRINPEQVWDYLSRVHHSSTREMVIIRFQAASDEENNNYVQLYSYLSGRNRCGVAGNIGKVIKDMYIVPLAAQSRIPSALLPLEGPGFGENRPHMLLGVIVRQCTRRSRPQQQLFKPVELDVVPKHKMAASVQRPDIPIPKPSVSAGPVAPPRMRDPRLARQQGHHIASRKVHGTMIPPQPDRPNTPPLHLMPPDQPYAKDLAASAYNVDVGAPSEPSSEDDEDHDHIIRQFGKPSTASSFTSAKPAKPTVKPSTQEEDAAPYSPSMIDLDDDDDDEPYEPGDDLGLDLGVPKGPATTVAVSTPSESSVGLLAGLTNINMASILDKVSTSTNPNEMTAAMVATLAATTSTTGFEEQKKLLLELSAKVEEQKKMLEKKKGENKKILEDAADQPEKAATIESVSTSAVTLVIPGLTTASQTPTTTTTAPLKLTEIQREVVPSVTAIETHTESATSLPLTEKQKVKNHNSEGSKAAETLPPVTESKDSVSKPASFYTDLYIESVPNLARKRLAQKIGDSRVASPTPEKVPTTESLQVQKIGQTVEKAKPEPPKETGGGSSIASPPTMAPELIPLPVDSKTGAAGIPAPYKAPTDGSVGGSTDQTEADKKSMEKQVVSQETPEAQQPTTQLGNIAILPDTIQKLFADHSLQDLRKLVGLAQSKGEAKQDDKPVEASTHFGTAAGTAAGSSKDTDSPLGDPININQSKHDDLKQNTDVGANKEGDEHKPKDDELEAAMNDPGGMFEVMRKQTEALFGPSKWAPTKKSSSDVPKEVKFAVPEPEPPKVEPDVEEENEKEDEIPLWKPAPSHIPPELRPTWKPPEVPTQPKEAPKTWAAGDNTSTTHVSEVGKVEPEAGLDRGWKGQFGTAAQRPPWESNRPGRDIKPPPDWNQDYAESQGSVWGPGFCRLGSHPDSKPLHGNSRPPLDHGLPEDDTWGPVPSAPSKEWGTGFPPRKWDSGEGHERGPPKSSHPEGLPSIPPSLQPPVHSPYQTSLPNKERRQAYAPSGSNFDRPSDHGLGPSSLHLPPELHERRHFGGPTRPDEASGWGSSASFPTGSHSDEKPQIPSIFDLNVKAPSILKNKNFRLGDTEKPDEEKIKCQSLDSGLDDKKHIHDSVLDSSKAKDEVLPGKVMTSLGNAVTPIKPSQGIRFSISSSLPKTLPILSKSVDMENLTSTKPDVKPVLKEVAKEEITMSSLKIEGKAGWKPIGQEDKAKELPSTSNITDVKERNVEPEKTVPVTVPHTFAIGDIPLPGKPGVAVTSTDLKTDQKKDDSKHSRSRSHSQEGSSRSKSNRSSDKSHRDKRSRSRSRDKQSKRDRRSRSRSRDKGRRRSRSKEKHHSKDVSPAKASRRDYEKDRYRSRDDRRRSPQRGRDSRRSPDRSRSQRYRSPERKTRERRPRSRSRSRDRKGGRSREDGKREHSPGKGKSNEADAKKESALGDAKKECDKSGRQTSETHGVSKKTDSTNEDKQDSTRASSVQKTEETGASSSHIMKDLPRPQRTEKPQSSFVQIDEIPPSTQYPQEEESTPESRHNISRAITGPPEGPPRERSPFDHIRERMPDRGPLIDDPWRRPSLPPPSVFQGPLMGVDHTGSARLQEELKRQHASLGDKEHCEEPGPPPPKRPREIGDHDNQREMYLGRPPFRGPASDYKPDFKRVQPDLQLLQGTSEQKSLGPPGRGPEDHERWERRLQEGAHNLQMERKVPNRNDSNRDGQSPVAGPLERRASPFSSSGSSGEPNLFFDIDHRRTQDFDSSSHKPGAHGPPREHLGQSSQGVPEDFAQNRVPRPRVRDGPIRDGPPFRPPDFRGPYGGPPPKERGKDFPHGDPERPDWVPPLMERRDVPPLLPTPFLGHKDGVGQEPVHRGYPFGLPPDRPSRRSEERAPHRIPDERDPSHQRNLEDVNLGPRRPDERGLPPRRPDDRTSPPRRPDDRGPLPRRPDDRGPTRRPDDRGSPPRRPDDRGIPPRRPSDRGPPPRRPDDRGPPSRRPDDRGSPPRRPDERGLPPRRLDDRGPPRRPDDRGSPPRRPDDRSPLLRRPDDRGLPPRRPDDRGSPPRRPDDRGLPPRRPDDRGLPPRRPEDQIQPLRRSDDRGPLPNITDERVPHRTSEEGDIARRHDERFPFHGRAEEHGPPHGPERGPPPRILSERVPPPRTLSEGGPPRETVDRSAIPRRPDEHGLDYSLERGPPRSLAGEPPRHPRGPLRDGPPVGLIPDIQPFDDVHGDLPHRHPPLPENPEHYRGFPERGPLRLDRIPPGREHPPHEPTPYERGLPSYPRDFHPDPRDDIRPLARLHPAEGHGRQGPPNRDIDRDRGYPSGPAVNKNSERPTPDRSRGPSPSSESSSVSSESRRGSRPPSEDPDLHLQLPPPLGAAPDGRQADSDYRDIRGRPLPPRPVFGREGRPFPRAPGPPGPLGPPGELRHLLPRPPPPPPLLRGIRPGRPFGGPGPFSERW